MSNILVLSEEFVKRIFIGLGEMPSKFSHVVILDIEAQIKAAEAETHKIVALVEQHLAPLKAKVEAEKVAAEAVVAQVETKAQEVVDAGKAVAKVV